MKKEEMFTSTATTISGETINIKKGDSFYILKQRDIEFIQSLAWIKYEETVRKDYWANFVIGLLIGLIIMSVLK